ncbi:COMPASS complex protein [Mycena pura]|uniref:COMPASS complex protein n=1 Tax=Mycena pura TaxID=153505 RepID=A0AAD6YKA6_9AGAR|nr:COMPASS complex protein [Mycena pura]
MDSDPLPLAAVPPPAAPTALAQPQNRKRKRAPATSASPAPPEQGANGNSLPEVLSSRADLSSRPRLSISRGPNFLPTTEGSEFFKTELTGLNRIGYRYTPAGINPPGRFLPCRTIESNPTTFRISWEDRSSFVGVAKDGLGLLGSTGFRSARCNAPIREGRWYMEVKVVHGGGEHVHEDGKREGSHVRLGWGRREAPLNGPVGLDGYSYGYRDKTGDKVTLSRPRPYGRPFSSGDVIGMYICLPPTRKAVAKDPHDPARLKRERIAIDLKGQEVFEILEYPQSKEMAALMDYSGKSSTSSSIPSSSKKGKLPERRPSNPSKTNTATLRPLPTLPNSHVAFFLNGECQGVAFQDLYDFLQLRQSATARKAKERKRAREGVKEHVENPFDDGTLGYYPFISLFNEASVRLNPGPVFDFPPPPDIDALLLGTPPSVERNWRPCCDRYAEFMAEQWDLDTIEEDEAAVESARSAAFEKSQAEKKAQRDKKRQQTEARKRSKMAVDTAFPVSADDDRLGTMASNPSGPGQPSPLRHGTAYIPDASEDSGEPSLPFITYGPGNPSPLRHNTASTESETFPTRDDDKSITDSTEETPTKRNLPYVYGISPEFRAEDLRLESGTSAVSLSGPGQRGEGWTKIVHQRSATKSGILDDHRPKILAGPGQPSPPKLASLLYNSQDAHEMSPFTSHNPTP